MCIRDRLSAYSNLAISAEAIGKDLATSYFHEFQKLLKAYPEAASTTPEYELYYTSANYYLNIKDYMKSVSYTHLDVYKRQGRTISPRCLSSARNT